MARVRALGAALVGVALAAVLVACGDRATEADAPPPRAVDLHLTGGRVIDGTGAPARTAEVLVRDGHIVHVGALPPEGVAAGRTVDAAGRVVAPGFVDPHAHGDPLATPAFENFLAMGVTTIALGQDGSSPDVDDLAPWLATVAERGLGVNLAMFVGHGTLRERAGIGRDPAPDDAALARLAALLDDNLGVAFGLSTGLEYVPGLHAPERELIALAKVVGARDRLLASHMRNEDDDALEASLDELIRQGAHARVHAAHLKSVYGRGAERGREILAMLDAARADGVEISADVYPYTASYTGLALLFPVWAKTPEQFEVVKATRREELLAYLRERVNGRNGPEATLLGTAPHAGKTLADLATELEKPFEAVLVDDLGPDGGSAAYFIMDDALQAEIVADAHVAICSDGSPTGFHPRGHGTFARIVETFVEERGLLALPEAVRKMSSLPASILGLEDRGTIAEGAFADLVIFDPAQVRETATYETPHALAEGFDVVIVNGVVAREGGALVGGVRAGEVLRPPET
jgi:N-acyl-D-aspartate/D-glutamate deacylase